MSCVHFFEMTSPEIDKRNEKMGLNKFELSSGLCSLSAHTVTLIYHLADHWHMKYSILKTIKMARFVIGRLNVFKKLTYLCMIIIIGNLAYNTGYKSM